MFGGDLYKPFFFCHAYCFLMPLCVGAMQNQTIFSSLSVLSYYASCKQQDCKLDCRAINRGQPGITLIAGLGAVGGGLEKAKSS